MHSTQIEKHDKQAFMDNTFKEQSTGLHPPPLPAPLPPPGCTQGCTLQRLCGCVVKLYMIVTLMYGVQVQPVLESEPGLPASQVVHDGEPAPVIDSQLIASGNTTAATADCAAVEDGQRASTMQVCLEDTLCHCPSTPLICVLHLYSAASCWPVMLAWMSREMSLWQQATP